MGLFDIFKKKKKRERRIKNKEEITSLACDYDGFDLAFESGITNPRVYGDFNDIITNNKLSILDVESFSGLKIDSDDDIFTDFYDNWINTLLENKYVTSLTSDIDIKTFTNNINRILEKKDYNIQLDVEEIVNRYKTELTKYVFNGEIIKEDFIYDILEANIIADELRKYNLELISLFNGFDNNIITIIKKYEIDKLKDIEARIK